MSELSRREFVVGSAALVASAAAGCVPVAGEWPEEGSAFCSWNEPRVTMGYSAQAGRVLELHDARLTSGTPPRVHGPTAAAGLKRLLLALTAQVDLQAAWAQLLVGYQPGQIVGIKVNTLNRSVPTHAELVRALVDTLKADAGLAAEQILVWDRRLDELSAAGLTSEVLGCRVEGTEDKAQQKGSGRGYELQPICIGGQNARLSNIQTRAVDHLINFAVLKNHRASGFTGCLKNHYGTIHNPGEFHDKQSVAGEVLEARFEQAIPTINALDEVAGKARLWLLDGTIAVCKGDTDSAPDCLPNRLLASLDPVALDVQGRAIRDAEAQGATDDRVSAGWLEAAERVGLGKRAVKLESVA